VSRATRRLLEVWLLIAVATALYWPTAVAYSLAWSDFDNKGDTHGYLIALMCIALLYLRREELSGPVERASPFAYVALAALSLAWVLAYRASIQTAHELLFPIILWTAIYVVFGRRIARRCLFPVGFLYFAVPFWEAMNGALQALTIAATEIILRLIGVPVHFYGNYVLIPEGTFAIEGGCSGLHFLVVGTAIAAYYGELHRDSIRHRLQLIALAAALALLTNWIRVSTVIAAGHLTNMQSYLVRVSHYGFGWALFAAALAAFFLVASRLPASREERPSRAAGASADTRPTSATLALAFAAVVIGPALAWNADRADATASAAPPSAREVPGWLGPVPTRSTWRPVFQGADTEKLATYERGIAAVEWFTAEYAYQRHQKKLLGYFNSIVGSGEFAVLDEGVTGRGPYRFGYLEVKDPQGVQSILWYVYEIGRRSTTSGLHAQIWYGLSSLMGPMDSRIEAFRAKCEPDCTAARRQLELFIDSICDNASRFGDCRRDR
jgi:exosortase A